MKDSQWSGGFVAIQRSTFEHRGKLPCPLISIKGCPRGLRLAPIFMYSYNMQHDASYISNFFGTDGDTKFDEFFGIVPKVRGGGSFSIQKFMLQILGAINRAF